MLNTSISSLTVLMVIDVLKFLTIDLNTLNLLMRYYERALTMPVEDKLFDDNGKFIVSNKTPVDNDRWPLIIRRLTHA